MKVSEEYYIRILNTSAGWQQVKARPLVLEDYPFLDLFISRSEEYEEGEFFLVSEGKTGGFISGGDTEIEAIKRVDRKIKKYCATGKSMECLLENIAKRSGVSPRYLPFFGWMSTPGREEELR